MNKFTKHRKWLKKMTLRGSSPEEKFLSIVVSATAVRA